MERAGGREVEGVLDYSTDMFDEARMRRMNEHFIALLEKIVTNPEDRLSALTSLPEAERLQQLVEWNETRRAYPRRVVSINCLRLRCKLGRTEWPSSVRISNSLIVN